MPTTQPVLRACPFCGEPPALDRVNCIYPEGEFHSFAVRCKNQKCVVAPSTYNPGARVRTRILAAKRWN